MIHVFALLSLAFAQTETVPERPPVEQSQIEETKKSISQDERKQRETLSHLFVIDKNLRDIAKKEETLNQKALYTESQVKLLAQDVASLENKKDSQKEVLNHRLRQLYQDRGQSGFHWIFSSGSPVELERNHRFLKLMVDNDHRQLKNYLVGLQELNAKRAELKHSVGHLLDLRKAVAMQERELARQQSEKKALVAKLKDSKELKLSELRGLHSKAQSATYAFFERKGELAPPVDAKVSRAYGTYVDPKYRFRLEQKGNFYSLNKPENVHSVFAGKVVYAAALPGYGKAVIVDHGDNYYSVYAFASALKVTMGSEVQAGQIVAVAGQSSPLFGPGLYFEIRHFTDAIDPRPWIKDSETQASLAN